MQKCFYSNDKGLGNMPDLTEDVMVRSAQQEHSWGVSLVVSAIGCAERREAHRSRSLSTDAPRALAHPMGLAKLVKALSFNFSCKNIS
jgi:hypothetical protein